MSTPYFSDETQAALQAAEAEATTLNSPQVESEHILVGVLAQTGSEAALMLHNEFGLTLEDARAALFTADEPPNDDLVLSADSQRIVEQAISEARNRGMNVVTPMHLLLGVLLRRHEVSGTALDILTGGGDRRISDITHAVRARLSEY